MRLSIAVFFSCRNAEKWCDYGGVEGDQGVGKAGVGCSVSSRDLDGAGNDAVIIFGMRRWPRGYR